MKLIAKYLDLLQSNEQAVERLYHIYAERFPGESGFWGKLAKEERMHGGIISLLMDQIELQEVVFHPGDLDLAAMREIVEKANKHCDELDAGGKVQLRAALELGVKLESGMLEHKFFDYFEGSEQSFIDDMTALKKHTEEHLQRLKDKLDQCALGDTSEMPIDEDINE